MHIVRNKLSHIIIGQFISLLSVFNGLACITIETKYHKVIPLLLTYTYYITLSLLWLYRSHFKLNHLKSIYAIIAFVDSQANFINVYTFTIIQFEYPFIINFLSVIWTVLLTMLFITKYTYTHIHKIGLLITFTGICIILCSNISISHLFNSQSLKGLFCCLVTSVLYSVNSILQEKFLDSNEEIFGYLPWMGLIGSAISFVQALLFGEFAQMKNFSFNVIEMWLLFILTLVTITSISPFFIAKCGAAMFNFSLASTIFWSMLIDIFVINLMDSFNIYYFIGFIIVIIGLYIFYMKDTNNEIGNIDIELIRKSIKNEYNAI